MVIAMVILDSITTNFLHFVGEICLHLRIVAHNGTTGMYL